MKRMIKVIAMLWFIMLLLGCTNNQDIDNPEVPEQMNYTYEEFYADLYLYERYFEFITQASDDPIILSNSNSLEITQLTSNISLEKVYRDDILSRHNQTEYSRLIEHYQANLEQTLSYLRFIRQVLGDQSQIPMNRTFSPLLLPNATFTFVKSSKGYIYINTIIEHEYTFLKLGFNQHGLDYQQLVYYDTLNRSVNENMDMSYQYFKFLENKESISIDHNEQKTSIDYTNMRTGEVWTLQSGIGVLDNPYQSLFGYNLDRYDPKFNVEMRAQVLGDTMISEEYKVFDEHGWVYQYIDQNLLDNEYKLNMNIVTAHGWNYAIIGENLELPNEVGIYSDDGSILYSGPLIYTTDRDDVSLSLELILSQDEPLTDDLFSLETHGLYMDHPKANINFFDRVKIKNFSQLKDILSIEDLDLFADNLHHELYFFIDGYIRETIELKEDQVPIDIPLGDFKAYENALLRFSEQLQIEPNYIMGGSLTAKISDEKGRVLFSTSSFEQKWFDLNAMFFKHIFYGAGLNEGYYIDGTKEKLIEYHTTGPNIHYNMLDEQATFLGFMEAYADYESNESNSTIYQVKEINDTTFELTVFANTMMVGDISIVSFYENMGIYGLSGQEIIVTVRFNEDYSEFSESFTFSNLSISQDNVTYQVTLESFVRMTIESIDGIEPPIDSPNAIINLPMEMDQPLFVKSIHQNRYEISPGVQYLHLWLEPGEYKIDVTDSHLLSLRILDAHGQVVDYDHRFKITKRGQYIVEITSTIHFFTDFYVRENDSPHYEVFDLNFQEGDINSTIDLDGTSLYMLKIPSVPYDRVLVFIPSYSNLNISSEVIYMMQTDQRTGYRDHCEIDPTVDVQNSCYFYIPANTIQYVSLSGHYQGDFALAYFYSLTNEGNISLLEPINEWMMSTPTWLNDDLHETDIHFIITDEGLYELITLYKEWIPSAQYATLYDSNNQIIHYDWDHILFLEPGEYKIRYHVVHYDDSVKVLCIPKIIKHE